MTHFSLFTEKTMAACARKRPCVFSLAGSRPITQERTSFLPASRRNVVLSCVAQLVAYAHYLMCFAHEACG